jgi:hypothetical protein
MNALFTAPTGGFVSPDRVRNEMQALLRYAQTKFTDEQLSEASGVPARCIKSYRIEGREPTLGNALSLLAVLGRPALNTILGMIEYAARPLDASDELPCGEVVACILTHSSTIARAAADGRIDHLEAPACRKAADDLIGVVLPLSSAGAAA